MHDSMLLLIGDELLRGHVQDRNGQVIADRLRRAGFLLGSIQIVADRIETIRDVLRHELALPHTRLVVTCGGVGPTPDDVTYRAVAEAVSRPLVRHERIAQWARTWCPPIRRDEAHRALDKMAWIPEGSRLVNPDAIGGPLVALDIHREAHSPVTVVMLPGQPDIVDALLKHAVSTLPTGRGQTNQIHELTHELPEVLIASCFELIADDHPEVRLGSYPGDPMLLRLEGPSPQVERAAAAVERRLAELAVECQAARPWRQSEAKEVL